MLLIHFSKEHINENSTNSHFICKYERKNTYILEQLHYRTVMILKCWKNIEIQCYMV